jgi:hypothetical protein
MIDSKQYSDYLQSWHLVLHYTMFVLLLISG